MGEGGKTAVVVVILIIILAGVGFLVWYFLYYNKKKKEDPPGPTPGPTLKSLTTEKLDIPTSAPQTSNMTYGFQFTVKKAHHC
jgi:Trk-type K+ transport system membrane component